VDGYGKALELAGELPDCEVFSISDRERDVFEAYPTGSSWATSNR
jgi:hypothetical protein